MKYQPIIEHYQQCFRKHGDSHLGVDWPNYKDTLIRHKVMTEIIKDNDVSLLDFGCGLGHYYEYLKEGKGIVDSGVNYNLPYVVMFMMGKPIFQCLIILLQMERSQKKGN